jgi:hypothetical protein
VNRSRIPTPFNSVGTTSSLCGPILHAGLKFTQLHGYRGTAVARIPSPEHQRRRHVLDDLLDAAMSVLLRILEQLAELAVSQPFPDHGRLGRGKAPIRRSRRHMRSGQVMVLVTGAALNRIYSLPTGAAPDLHRMPMAVVSLTRKISRGVTVHAPRMTQYRNDGLKSSCRTVTRRGVLGCGIEYQQEGRQDVCSVSHIHASPKPRSVSRNAAVTRSGVKGKSRSRAPVASKMALPMAAGVTVIAVSPAPVAGTP